MYTDKIQCKLTMNSKSTIFSINLSDNSYININGLTINLVPIKNFYDVSIYNNSKESITLNELQIKLMTIAHGEYTSCTIQDELSLNKINTINFKDIKNKKNIDSFLYSIFFSQKESDCKLIGFLSSHSCRNYIKLSVEENSSTIYGIYDFVNHKLEPNSTLILDSIYTNNSRTYSELLNTYTENITEKLMVNNNYLKENNFEKTIENNLLFTDTVINETIKNNNHLISIKLNKKDAYLIDISSTEGKNVILEKCTSLINSNNCNVIHLKNIMPYIKKVAELNCFNPYYELNNLFKFLKSSIKDIYFLFDDCPLGLALGNLDIVNNSIDFIETTNLFKKLINKDAVSSLNYDFIIKTLLENSVFKHNTLYNIKNNKIKELLEVISMNGTLPKTYNASLLNALNDFDLKYPITLTAKSKEVFSFLRFGKSSIYLAVFNLSKLPSNFFLDLSSHGQYTIKNGIATDILNDKDYLISDNKIYIKNIRPMECLFIKKDLNKDELIQVAKGAV